MSMTVPILTTPEVLHGKPRIEGTGIGVFQIGEFVRRSGWSVADVTEEFELDAAQVRGPCSTTTTTTLS